MNDFKFNLIHCIDRDRFHKKNKEEQDDNTEEDTERDEDLIYFGHAMSRPGPVSK